MCTVIAIAIAIHVQYTQTTTNRLSGSRMRDGLSDFRYTETH